MQRDAYKSTGCYNTKCSGFVHTSSRIALEAAIIRTSQFGGLHFDITLQIWKRDAYKSMGCYNTKCNGFVHTSSRIALQAAIIHTSQFEGPQFDITLQIWKAQVSGHWWLGICLTNVEPIGCWPYTILTGLSEYAHTVEWGGEVLYMNSSSTNTMVQMGSGEFADKSFGRATYVCNIQVAANNQTLLPVHDFKVRADFPNYYTIKSYTKECGNHFHYGGPGPMQSSASLLGRSFVFIL